MLPIIWRSSARARASLAEIIDDIEQRNPLAAQALHTSILRVVEGLPSAPPLKFHPPA